MEIDKDFTVLAISDNYTGLDILNSILSPYYTIKMISSTNDALTTLNSSNVNLVILDCAMYGSEGYGFLSEVKSREDTMRIPVILIGDTNQPEFEELAFAFGAVDYISKPFRSSIVKVRVNNQRLMVKQIKAIEELGLLDHLTGIPNRRGFDNKIHLEWLRAIRDKTCISLAIADIDHFKVYNDEYGHAQGDVLLCTLAQKITSMLKRPADFVARWGGEEFVVMLPNTTRKGATAHAEEIRKSVEEMEVPNLPSATISIGVASIFPSINSSVTEIFNMADKALYQAKNTGRNKVCFFV
ncbi:MAG: diguanylate cyclase [Fibromonadaceae bacterium]|jgi:diguanylate cyclase (GGDEF)-like protein|nr:diguanylate cyclase [Fibromonadaceae bacterium]